MEIAFHCPNCLADLIYDESKKYTCCFCNTVLTPKDEVRELEGGYYVGDAWNENVYHKVHCDDCSGEFIMKAASIKQGCPMCSSTSLKDNGPMIGAMPRRAIPFAHTKQQAEEMFLDYIRNNSAVGRTLATDENKALIHKVYVPCWIFTYEVVAHARLTAMLRNKANDGKTIMGINAPEQLVEFLSPLRSSISRFQPGKRNAAKDAANQPSEHVTGGVLSWQGIPFDATGLLPNNLMNCIQPYDQSKMVTLTEKVLADTPVLSITKDPITCMQEFMERVKKWTRQMIMDAHSDSYDISYFQDRTDYPLGIGELVLFPIWYMRGDYMGREFYFAMNGQNGEVEANIPMSKVSSKNAGITYQQYWDKARCSALKDTHFEFDARDPNIEILDYSFFEKPKDSRVSASGKKKADLPVVPAEESVAEPEAEKKEAASKTKKPVVPLDVEVVTDLKSLPKNKKLTKEEEQKRAREMTARMRAAAKEKPKGEMEAAAEAPSWAKAVTPPPAASSAGARPARRKKPAIDGPSIASSNNKPIWERPVAELDDKKPGDVQPPSLAHTIARAAAGEEIEKPVRNVEPQAPVQEETPALDNASQPIWNRQPEIGSFPEFRSSDYPASKHAPVKPSLVESADDVLRDAPAAREVEIPAAREIEQPIWATPEAREIPQPEVEAPAAREIEQPIFKKPEPVEESAKEEFQDDDEMVANITFSFNKKKSSNYSEEKPATNAAIPRRTDSEQTEARGMAIMNSEYDSGVLPGSMRSHEVEESAEPREIVPRVNETENYFGSDANDRPLAYRPAAPLAQARNDMYVEEVETHPEQDIMNRPLAYRPAAPLAKLTEAEVIPNPEYNQEKRYDEDLLQMPSLDAVKPRWGEMPEAKETPSWAKPQQSANNSSPFGTQRTNTRHLSREQLRAKSELAERQVEAREERNTVPSSEMARTLRRPAATPEQQPAAEPPRRPGRPAAQTRPEPKKANENVPIWERVPETNGPVPAWGASAAHVDDERPWGSLSKPKDQIIDVEKPRERPTLWRGETEAKEVLPGATRDLNENVREVVVENKNTGVREIMVETPVERAPETPAPSVFSKERRLTFAQQRQLEEEARRKEIQSSFAPQRDEDVGSPFRRYVEEPEEPKKSFEPEQFENKPSVVASLDMLPDPVSDEEAHHLAKERSVPPLAQEADPFRSGLNASEEAAKKGMRGLPDYDPDGPSPFK